MTPKDYWKSISPEERNRVAKDAGTTVAYMVQLAGGFSKASAKLSLELEKATRGYVSRHDWRPDLYPPEQRRVNG